MHIPSSTYRIQFHKDYTFKQAAKIADYLNELGVSTLYASPVLTSTPGSMHGYDITDPHAINPEIGTAEELKSLSRKLTEKGMYWLQDIVPNHMAFNTLNFRLMDVLERGNHSPYYQYFDIIWNHPSLNLQGKLNVPFLGNELSECIEKGDIKISFSDQGFTIDYLDTHYPLSIQSYQNLASIIGNAPLGYQIKKLIDNAIVLKDVTEWRKFKGDWNNEIDSDPPLKDLIGTVLSSVNSNKELLIKLLETQNYTLTYWLHTEHEINYRRFFTVNELICLRMEDESVFNEYHTFLYSLYQDKLIHGLRIDHIDGLQDPAAYIRRLRKLFGESVYVIAEKILEAKEEMPESWPLQGTSGYEFLSFVSQLMTDRKGSKQLINYYKQLIPQLPRYKELVYENKELILENYMGGELDNLLQYLFELELQGSFDKIKLKQALAEFMLALPVYRIYPENLPLTGVSLTVLRETFEIAHQHNESVKSELNYLRRLFLDTQANAKNGKEVLAFLKRLMQFTGPLTAKGVEDTTFYVYNPLISHDEVGDSPSALGISVQDFHTKMILRQQHSPLSLNATATHDTKRGEDARLRLNLLSEMGTVWQQHVEQWFTFNKPFHKQINGNFAPEINDEYFIYQAIVGSFPEDYNVTSEWIERLKAYLTKALREAKAHTNWTTANTEYEEGCLNFIDAILEKGSEFLKSFIPFIKNICSYSAIYSIGQTLIKITAPGIPDTYQGCELFDLSFVDPDNRRPVDYEKRISYLTTLKKLEAKGPENVLQYVKEKRETGIEKLFVTWKALNFRKEHNALFIEGDYIPLQIAGNSRHAIAYCRENGTEGVIIVVPLGLVASETPAEINATNSFIVFPEIFPGTCYNIFTGKEVSTQKRLALEDLLSDFPIALLSYTKG